MAGHVHADGPSIYLLHGWKGNEDEDVDVDISGGSSDEEIEGLKQHAPTISTAAPKSLNSKKVLNLAETSVQGTSDAEGQECNSLAAKLGADRVRTSKNAEQILTQTTIAKQKKGPEERVGPGENSGAKGNSFLQPRKSSDNKRLDARRFRDHFAAKLDRSKRANIAEDNGQGEASSALKGKIILDGPLEPTKGEFPQQAGSKVVRESLIENDEDAVMLHVNLEVEQEKDIELPCNGDCNAANKESFQVFTRKRKQASEGATQSDCVFNQNISELEVDTIDERSPDPKDAERTTGRSPDSPKLNTIYGRSKRARKHTKQTDYIPWSDFGRLPAKKSEINKSGALVDSGAGTEADSKQSGSKNSLEKNPEDNSEISREIGVAVHPSTSKVIDLDDRDSKNDSQNSVSKSVAVDQEHDTRLTANHIGTTCSASGKELPVLPNKCIGSSSVHDKNDQQDSEIDVTKMQDKVLPDGTMNSAKGGSMDGMRVLQNGSDLDNDSNRCPDLKAEEQVDDIEIDPNRHPDPKAQEQGTHEGPSADFVSHVRDDLRLLMRERSETFSASSFRQGVEVVGPPKVIAKDNHDSVCDKCKRGGQLICCDGKNCKITYHIDCLDPPLKDVPPNDWYCPCCACKRIFSGMHLVSKGIESIWDVKVGNDGLDRGATQTEAGVGDARQPEAVHEATAVSDAARIAAENPSETSITAERLYLVKYKGVAHVHNLWLGESQLAKEAPKLLINYKRQVEQGKAPKWDPEWVKPFRVIGKRKTMLAKLSDAFPTCEDGTAVGHCIEWCIKWKNLGYEACTWEPVEKTPLDSAHLKKLIADYETRSAKTVPSHHAEHICRVEAHSNSGMLVDCQSLSDVIEKLLSLWKKQSNSIAVNEIHQDRMRTAIGFLHCLRAKFAVSKPFCVVVSPVLLGEWKAAFKKWMPNANVVVYGGSKEARKIIQRYEFYNENGLCMVQIVLTSYDTLNLDVEVLKELSLEALIIDECQRLKGTKTSKSLRQFASLYRLLLLSEPIKSNLEDYHYIIQELAGGKEGTPHEDNVTLMQLKTLVSKHIVLEGKQESSNPAEFWVPVKMTAFQLQQYCKLLIEKCDLLVRGKRGDIASSPHELLLKLRECCNHPFLVRPGFQESLTNLSAKQLLEFGIRASGKLKLLDTMLWEAKTSNKRVLIITQINLRAGKVSLMDVLDDYMRQQFGVDSYERLDNGVEKSKKSAAVQRFNALNSKCFVFLLDRRACGSSIKLQSVNCIIIFDSDWNPQTDIQSLLRMYSVGDLEHMTICRFYCTHSVEERILISARKQSDLDSNYHNFTVALCQKLLRWGAFTNFELYDTLSKDKVEQSDEVMYSKEMVNYFLGTGDTQSFDELCAENDFFRIALSPRRTSEYSESLPLYEEENEEHAEEERVSTTEFWSDLLKDRQLEVPDVQGRELRTRKKVQYHEDSLDVPVATQASMEEEEESRRKRRKFAEASDSSTVVRGGRSTSVERSPIMGVDVQNTPIETLDRPHMSRPSDNVERVVLQRSKPGAGEGAHSPSHGNRTTTENRTPTGEPEATSNEASNDPTAAKSEQQQVLLSMKADLDKLCQALQFQADTAGHVEQLLFSVGNFFRLPKERRLLHAVELSLCWLAAEQQHYCIDRRATQSLAESCFGVQLDRVENVYAKLEQRWKKRLEQGVLQPQGTRGQDKDASHSGEQDRAGRLPDQEPLRDKHGLSQAPTSLGSLEGTCTVAQVSASPREVQVLKQGHTTSATIEQHQGSAAHRAQTSELPLEGQVSVGQSQASSGIRESGLLEPITDVHRVSSSQQQRSGRSHLLINAQKNQIAALEKLELKYKQRLKQHYESALAKLPRTTSSEEQSRLSEGWKNASSAVTNAFRVIRGNLIKHQCEERGKEHRLSSPQLGRDNAVESLNQFDKFNEETVYQSLAHGLRMAIENGDFGSGRPMSGSDLGHCPPPNIGNVINNNSSQGPLTSNLPDLQPVSSSQMHVAPNAQQERHLSQRQVHDSVLQQQRRPGALPTDPILSQVVSSNALQSQQRQHVTPQPQRLPITRPQSPSTTTPRPPSPIPLPQQLSQAPPLPQQPQLVPEIQLSQPLQRGAPVPPRYGHQANIGSGLNLTIPNEVAQPSSVSGTHTATPSSGRAVSGGVPAANRVSQSGQLRSNQQYHNDPLAQEFLRLRKEQDKLKTFHESERDRIKAQFIKELELLSKRHDIMLQEEDANYAQKASALESHLKKVEMNRRLAEVFRLKNAQESPAVNSVPPGQDIRAGTSQGHNYQQNPAFLIGRASLSSAVTCLPQTSGAATAGGSFFERPARVAAQSMAEVQTPGAFVSPLWHSSQGSTGNMVAGFGSNAVSAVGATQSRSVVSTSTPGSNIEPFRIPSQLSIAANLAMQRLTAASSTSPPIATIVSTSGVSTMRTQDSQGLNVAPISSLVHGASNNGVGGGLGGFPTNNFLSSASFVATTPQVLAGSSIGLLSAAQTLALAQDGHLGMGSPTPFPELSGSAIERGACDTYLSQRPRPFLANNESSVANDNRCMNSTTLGNHAYVNPEALNPTTLQPVNVQDHVISGLSSAQGGHINEGQDSRLSDVICLSDDD